MTRLANRAEPVVIDFKNFRPDVALDPKPSQNRSKLGGIRKPFVAQHTAAVVSQTQAMAMGFKGDNLSKETLHRAQRLLAELSIESPLRFGFENEWNDLCKIRNKIERKLH